MNTDKHQKSAGSWVHRLFERSCTGLSANQSKTYFGKRYQTGETLLKKNPFNALFSEEDRHQPLQESETQVRSTLFEQERSIHDVNSRDIECSQACEGNSKKAIKNSYLNPKNTATTNKFTVLNCYDETLYTKTFRLGILGGQKFDYLPGQYITLSVVVDGKPYKRSYSIASTPSRPGIIEITVKRDPNGGIVSNWLNNHLKVGDTLTAKGPYGKFSCAANVPTKILLLAAGSGVVPIMSMLRWLTDTEAQVEVSVLLSFRASHDIIYRDELNLLAARHRNLTLLITLTKEPTDITQWPGLIGRIAETMIASCVPDLPERFVYLCGSDAFMVDSKAYLENLKLPKDRLFCESFTCNTQILEDHETYAGELLTKSPTSGLRPLNKLGNYRLKFAKSSITIVTDGSRTLLDVAETAGLKLDHECRSGSCGECMVKCLEGKVMMTEQAEIDDCDQKRGWIYACCAYPASDAVLDI